MLLARPQGAVGGTRGVGLFLMPRRLDDGSPNHYRIVRLKDKLGTRSMASGEIKLEGAIAYAVGQARSRLRADGRDGQFVAAFQRRQIHRADAPRPSRRDDGRAKPRGVRQPHHRSAAGAAAIDEDHARDRAGAVDEFSHRRRARPRRGRQPGRGGAVAHSDADAEIPRHARCPQGLRRRAGDARRHRLHRGIRHRAAVARRASRLDLGRHRQHRRHRCAEAGGRPPWRRCRARRRPACPARRQRQRAERLSRSPARAHRSRHRLCPRGGRAQRQRSRGAARHQPALSCRKRGRAGVGSRAHP